MIILSTIGIYKIENLNNNKIYIGQSVNIQKRFGEHLRNGKYDESSLIDSAIQDLGKDNFSFEIIKECKIEELDQEEKYYISYYNCIYPNGYNRTTGGSNSSVFLKYSPSILNQIIIDLKESNLSFKEIANKYQLDLSMVYYLNRGDYHFQENEKYPLRKVKDFSKQYYYCIDCGEELKTKATRCPRCAHKAQRKVERPSREILKDMIRSMPFTKIGLEFNVSDNAIRKWCVEMKLPARSKDIKKISDKEWEKL